MRMPSGRPLRRPGAAWKRGACAVVAGALAFPVFPEPGWWWWAYVALVPWILLLRTAPTGRRAVIEGWLGGMGFLMAVHHWLLPSLHVFIVVLAAVLGILWAPWGWLVRRMLHGTPGPGRTVAALAVVPSGWLLIEAVRSWEYLGGPWGLMGASQWQVEPALRLASVGGVWLLGFLVVAVNTGLAALIAVPRRRTAVAAALVAGTTGAWALSAWTPGPERTGSVRVAVVQPGVITGADNQQRRFDRQEELTRQIADRRPAVVVWGESGVSRDLGDRPELRRRLTALSRETGAALLVNVDARDPGRDGIYKSSVLVGPEGPTGQRYDKMRLVPFGEYIPARSLLGWATSVGKAAPEDRRRGAAPEVMDLPETGHGAGGLRLGPLVCFETSFPDMSRALVRDGAQVLVAQSSTSTFQHSWAPEQHASLGALRAAETWRPMVHATLTGVSAVYGPDGSRVGGELSTDASTAAVYDVPLGGGTSPFVRYGEWPLQLSVGVLLVFGAVEAGRRIRGSGGAPRRRRTRTAGESAVRPRQ